MNIWTFGLCTSIEFMKLIIVMCGILNYGINKKRNVLILSAVIFLLLTTGGFFLSADVVLASLVAIITSWIIIKGKNRILFSIISFFSVSCTDEFINYFNNHFLYRKFDIVPGETENIIFSNSLGILVMLVITFILKNTLFKNSDREYNKKINNVYLLIFAAVQSVALLYITVFSSGKSSESGSNNAFIAYIVIFSLVFAEILLIYNINSKHHYREVSDVNQKLLATQETYYRNLLNKEHETRKFRHDISSHIMCIEALMKERKYDEVQEYLNKMNNTVSELKPKYSTGNFMINSILEFTASKYPDVQLLWKGLVPEKLNISDMDVCTITSNILDNAFASASKCKDEKIVSVTAKTVSGNLMIIVENNIGEPVKQERGLFATSKSDRENHGFGTQNVRKCVSSLSGNVDFRFDEKIFTTEVIIPNAF